MWVGQLGLKGYSAYPFLLNFQDLPLENISLPTNSSVCDKTRRLDRIPSFEKGGLGRICKNLYPHSFLVENPGNCKRFLVKNPGADRIPWVSCVLSSLRTKW